MKPTFVGKFTQLPGSYTCVWAQVELDKSTWQVELVKLTCHPRLRLFSKTIDKWHLVKSTCQVNLSSQLAWWTPWNQTNKLSQEPPPEEYQGGGKVTVMAKFFEIDHFFPFLGSTTHCHPPHTSAALCFSVYRLGLCHAGAWLFVPWKRCGQRVMSRSYFTSCPSKNTFLDRLQQAKKGPKNLANTFSDAIAILKKNIAGWRRQIFFVCDKSHLRWQVPLDKLVNLTTWLDNLTCHLALLPLFKSLDKL